MLKINRIISLCSYLPKKDADVALQLISQRDFESLEELIKSCLELIKINRIKETPNKAYIELDENKIMELYTLVIEYKEQLIISEDD